MPKQQIELQPPQSIDAEQMVLGSILKDQRAIFKARGLIHDESYFYHPKHQIIYRAVLSLVDRDEPCDIMTVSNALVPNGKLEKIGGRQYLVELVEGVGSTANLESYIKIVVDCYTYRQLIDYSNATAQSAYRRDVEPKNLLTMASEHLLELLTGQISTAAVHVGSVIREVVERIDRAERGVIEPGLQTGFDDIDEKIGGGMKDGDLLIMAGRPSMGKTAAMSNMTSNICRDGGSVLFFSSEMEAKALAHRILCAEARVGASAAWRGDIDRDDCDKLVAAQNSISNWRLWIDDTNGIDVSTLATKAMAMHSSKKLSAVVVDYIQMIDPGRKVQDPREGIGIVVSSLKRLARNLGIPVIAGCQISRQAETRKNKYPMMADLKESGKIEEDADVIMALFRPEVYAKEENKDKHSGIADVLILKNRNGPTGKVQLYYAKRMMRFENLARRHEIPTDVAPAQTDMAL